MAGAEILARVVANICRAALRVAGLGKGCHGFAVALPSGGRSITLRRANDGALLGKAALAA